MWYQAWPHDWDGVDVLRVGLAESDDGLTWRRSRCGLVEFEGSTDNALTDLPMHSASVVLEADAQQDERYRVFGFFHPRALTGLPGRYGHLRDYVGYVTGVSSDGVHWPADKIQPLWPSADVITAASRPSGGVTIMMKQNRLLRGKFRRAFSQAEWRNGALSPPRHALWPTALDDQISIRRGFLGCDYYGVGLEPRSDGATIGYLWNFRHQPPLGSAAGGSLTYGDAGQVDASVVYQFSPDGGWHHASDTDVFLGPGDVPEWAFGCIYTSPNVVVAGEECRLYFTGTREYHGWVGAGAATGAVHEDAAGHGGFARIGLARWPKDRLCCVEARFREYLYLHDAPLQGPMRLNVRIRPGGRVRAALVETDSRKSIDGFGLDECSPISGDSSAAELRWGQKRRYTGPLRKDQVSLQVELSDASLFAWESE
jgi:hypothetical protein